VFWKVASFIGGHMIKWCMKRDYDPAALHQPEAVTLWLKEASERYGILESA
jgi:hypothetical protein